MTEWRSHPFPKRTCYCLCGNVYRSKAKLIRKTMKFETQETCEKCKKTNQVYKIVTIKGLAVKFDPNRRNKEAT